MRYRVLILLLILVTKLSPVKVQATGEENIAPAKRGKRAQFLFPNAIYPIWFVPDKKPVAGEKIEI